MSFVEPPVVLDGNPHEVHFVQDDPRSADCPFQHRCENEVERVSLLLKREARFFGFFYALLGKVNIRPPGKEVFFVPDTLSVTKQHDFVHVSFPLCYVGGIGN